MRQHPVFISLCVVSAICALPCGALMAEEVGEGSPFELRKLTEPDVTQVIVSDTSEMLYKGLPLFTASALTDGRLWSTWGSDHPEGAWIEIRFSTVRYVTRMQLMPIANDSRLERTRRIRRLTITWDGGSATYTLTDAQALTTLDFPQALITSRVRLTVEDTWGRSGPLALGELMVFEPSDIFALKPELRQEIQTQIEALRDRTRRDEAIARLEAIGNPAITWLTLALADTDAATRAGAARALIGTRATNALEPVAEALTATFKTDGAWRDPDEVEFIQAGLRYLSRMRATRGAEIAIQLHHHPAWRDAIGPAVVGSLAATGHPDGLATLEDAMLRGPEWALAAMPGFAHLGELGARTLNRLAFNRSPQVRLHVAQAVQFWSDHEVMPSIRTLSRDPSPAVRAQLLRSLGVARHAQGEPFVLGGTRDSDATVRLAAAEALSSWRSDTTLTTLKELANDDNARIRLASVRALGRQGEGALETLVSLLDDQGSADVVAEAERMLRRVGHDQADALLPLLEERLQDRNPKQGQRAAHLMAACGPAGVEKLMTIMEEHENTLPSFFAHRALKANSSDAVAAIHAHLAQRPSTTYGDTLLKQYVQILAASGDPDVVATLARLSSDPRAGLRAEVMRAMHHFNTLESRRVVVRGLSDRATDVREQAAMAAGVLRIRRAVPHLIALIEREDSAMLRAIKSLGQIRDERALGVLHGLLTHERSTVRQYACDALGELGRSESLALLIELLEDQDEVVRDKAIRAVERIH